MSKKKLGRSKKFEKKTNDLSNLKEIVIPSTDGPVAPKPKPSEFQYLKVDKKEKEIVKEFIPEPQVSQGPVKRAKNVSNIKWITEENPKGLLFQDAPEGSYVLYIETEFGMDIQDIQEDANAPTQLDKEVVDKLEKIDNAGNYQKPACPSCVDKRIKSIKRKGYFGLSISLAGLGGTFYAYKKQLLNSMISGIFMGIFMIQAMYSMIDIYQAVKLRKMYGPLKAEPEEKPVVTEPKTETQNV